MNIAHCVPNPPHIYFRITIGGSIVRAFTNGNKRYVASFYDFFDNPESMRFNWPFRVIM